MIRQDIALSSPWMNSAGSLGFAPPAQKDWPFSQPPGGFVTNPISRNPRTPAADRACIAYPGGYLLHTGLPNPGFKQILRKFARRWSQSSIPIWAHLIAGSPDEVAFLVKQLEDIEGIMAVELGLPPEASTETAFSLVQAASGELPIVVEVPLSAVGENWVNKLPGCGVSALTLSAPRGALLNKGLSGLKDPQVRKDHLVQGRLYGPCLFPQVLSSLRQLRPLGIPIIAGAGVYSRADGEALLAAGAAAVQLDSALWMGNAFVLDELET